MRRFETFDGMKKDTNMAVLAHLLSFAGYVFPFGNLLAPFVLYSLQKDRCAFSAEHARACFNFQMTLFVLAMLMVMTMLAIVIISKVHMMSHVLLPGAIGLLALTAINFVLTLVACIHAHRGDDYQYPFSLTFVS